MAEDKILTISAERIKQAAEKCPTAKEVLKVLCPEAFEDEHELHTFETFPDYYAGDIRIERRTASNFRDRGLFLDDLHEWVIVTDKVGYQVLTAKKR